MHEALRHLYVEEQAMWRWGGAKLASLESTLRPPSPRTSTQNCLRQSFWCPADALELYGRSDLDQGRERLDEASAGK